MSLKILQIGAEDIALTIVLYSGHLMPYWLPMWNCGWENRFSCFTYLLEPSKSRKEQQPLASPERNEKYKWHENEHFYSHNKRFTSRNKLKQTVLSFNGSITQIMQNVINW